MKKILQIIGVLLFITQLSFGQSYQIYWSDYSNDDIKRAYLNGSNTQTIVNIAKNGRSLTIDEQNGHIYYPDETDDKIYRCDLDGTDRVVIQSFTALQNEGIAIDVESDMLYWTNAASGYEGIFRVSLSDLANPTRIVHLPSEICYGIAIDHLNNKLYWTQMDEDDNISYSNLDGGAQVELLDFSSTSNPYGIALDVANNKMYWCETGGDRIAVANLDGSGSATLIPNLGSPRWPCIDFVNNQIYWTDYGTGYKHIRKANLDGSGSVSNVVTGLSGPVGLHVYGVTPPVVNTSPASSVGENSATLGGDVILRGTTNVSERGIVYSSSDNTPIIGEAGVTKNTNGSGTGTYSESIGSLTSATTYYFRAYATNASGTDYGDTESFETAAVPTVSTTDATTITGNSAVLGGNVTNQGGDAVSERGVVYSSSDNTPTIGEGGVTKDVNGSGIGSYSETISSLSSGTTYYVRAFATNSGGDGYGAVVSFTTLEPATITTSAANFITDVTSTLGGNISNDGGASVTERGIVYSISDNTPTIDEAGVTKDINGTGTGIFSESIGSLSQSTIYYFQAYAINSAGTSYGGVENFTTDDNLATKIYWTDRGDDKIEKINLNGSNPRDVCTGIEDSKGVVVDEINDFIYFTDYKYEKIVKVNRDGSNAIDIYSGAESPIALAIDNEQGHLYFSNNESSNYNITRIDLDGSNATIIVTFSPTNSCYGLALDFNNNRLYYTLSISNEIRSCDLDGSNDVVVADSLTDGVDEPLGIAINPNLGKIFWSNSENDKIRSSDLDGSNIIDIISSGAEVAQTLFIDYLNSKLYWVERQASGQSIRKADFDGANASITVSSLNDPYGLYVYGVGLPISSTANVSSITLTSATLGGEVLFKGGATVSERGIVYSNSETTPTIGETGVTKDSNGSGIGSFSKTIGSLTQNVTYYYRSYATNFGGTYYGEIKSFTTLASAASTFSGTANWASGTWSAGIPGSSTDVTISGACTIDDDYSCDDLIITQGNSVTVNDGKTLSVGGNLTINSDATGDGSLISKGSVNVIGTTTVQRYIQGYSESSGDGWHHLSSPMNAFLIDGTAFDPDDNDDFYAFDEVNYQWLNQKVEANNITGFIQGIGYLVAFQNTATKSFSGTLNNNDITLLNLSHTPEEGGGNGWHVLGNPFPCGLNWNDGNWNLSNVNGIAKVWNEISGNYTDINADEHIPAMNGITVQVSSSTNTITIPKAARVHTSTNWMKEVKAIPNRLTLKVSTDINNFSDKINLLFRDGATDQFDWEFDSHKLSGNYYAPQLYMKLYDEYYSTNTLSTDIEMNCSIPVHLSAKVEGTYKLSLDLYELPESVSVDLEDLTNGVITDLKNNAIISVNVHPEDDSERFILHLKNSATYESENSISELAISQFDNTIIISDKSGEDLNGVLNLFDISGRLLISEAINSGNRYSKTLNFASGIYILKFTSKTTISKKIIIQ